MSQYDKYIDEYMAMRKDMIDRNVNAEFPAMLELLGDIKGKKLLDLGCGFGLYDKVYCEKGASVVALDNSRKEIEYARSLNIPGADFQIYDISKKLPLNSSSIDVIASSLAIDHLENLNNLFMECGRILKKEGIMVFSISNPVFYQEESLAGKSKMDGKTVIYGNYFERRKIIRTWGGTAAMEHYHKPLEDYFSVFLNNGFELLSFKEPQAKSQEITWHSRNPTFLVFKIRKKQNYENISLLAMSAHIQELLKSSIMSAY